MAGIRIEGNTSGNVAEVTTLNQLKVVSPSALDGNGNPAGPGNYSSCVFESDAGTVTGTSTVRQGDISSNYRQRVSVDTLLFNETFLGTALNSAQFSSTLTSFTTSTAGGFHVLNAASVTTASAAARLTSYRGFPCYGTYPLQLEVEAVYAAASVQANVTVEIGLGFASGTAAPTDGCFFRYNAAGEFRAAVVFNGVETVSGILPVPTVGVRHHYILVINNDAVDFWVDNILYAAVAVPAANGMALLGQNPPIMIRQYHAVTVPSLAVQFKIAAVCVTLGDALSGRSFLHAQVGMGGGAYQGQTGGTMGSTANYANSSLPGTAALSNTAAGYTTLGGQFQFAAVVGAETDYALFAFQVPVAAVTGASKTLMISRVTISTINTVVAVATTAHVLQWALGVGSSATSLATTESTTTKARRVLTLGIQSFPIGAAVGALATDINVDFGDVPVMCEPGCFVHVILKMPIATATATQVLRGTVLVHGVFE